MNDPKIGRRSAAKRFLTVLGAAALAPAALAACGGDEEEALSCNDTGGMPPNAVTMRQQQNYTDESHVEGERCDNCNFYTAGQANGCGQCSVLMNTAVHPAGHCGLWAAAA